MDTAHLAIGPDQCDRFVLKRTNRRNHGKDERRANHRALRRSRRGSSARDLFTLAVLDAREQGEQPFTGSRSLSVPRPTGLSPAATRSSAGTRESQQPLSPNLCSMAAAMASTGGSPSTAGTAHGRQTAAQWDGRGSDPIPTHQSNSSVTNTAVLEGTTLPCSDLRLTLTFVH